jgi:transcriptional regulator with XRE-family HTH domain
MDSDINHIGQRIRRLRRESKMTLLEVATASSLSVGFLSQVERNLTGISISSLVNVAKALNVPLGALLEHPRQAQPDSHEGRRESYQVGPMRQKYERLSTTFDGSTLNAVKVLMMEGYSSEWVAHGGDEFVYVLSGKVRYTLRRKNYELTAGDSLHFDAQHRHRVVNLGPGPPRSSPSAPCRCSTTAKPNSCRSRARRKGAPPWQPSEPPRRPLWRRPRLTRIARDRRRKRRQRRRLPVAASGDARGRDGMRRAPGAPGQRDDDTAVLRSPPRAKCWMTTITTMAARIASEAEIRFRLSPPCASGFVNVSPSVAPSGRVKM